MTKNLINTGNLVFLGRRNLRGYDGLGTWLGLKTQGMYTESCWGNPTST